MPVLRLFAQAREAAGSSHDVVDGTTVDQVLAAARERYGEGFAALLPTCKVWVNGEPALGTDPGDHHVSGGLRAVSIFLFAVGVPSQGSGTGRSGKYCVVVHYFIGDTGVGMRTVAAVIAGARPASAAR